MAKHPEGRIYVADLAAYNEGDLKGRWIVPSGDEEELTEQVQDVLRSVKRKGHPVGEEWAIHDYESFPDLGEYPSLKTVAATAAALEEGGDALLALLDYDKYWSRDIDAAITHVQDNLLGVFKNAEQELVYSLLDDGLITEKTMLDYVDAERFGRDVRMDLDEEGEDAWAAELSDEELGDHYIADGAAAPETLLNYFDSASFYRDFCINDVNVIHYQGQDYVFWNR